MSWTICGLFALVAYFLGSLPTGYLMAKSLKGIDIRECGSGSTGATNVLRTVGKEAAIAVLAIDILKGAIALLLVREFYLMTGGNILSLSWQPWLITFAGILAILGHSKSIWLQFKGGKSVATSLGVLLVMNPWVALGTMAVFGLVLVARHIVSLGSICGAIAVNILMVALHQPLPYCLFAAIAGIYVILRHRSNIERLLAGIEPAIGRQL
ncbi:MAG: glycerol-3-phosphate 1-O-acyltransferase PlsY [Cyanobacteria bacterium SBLK]|nr:glycerol-3-phosphate 1-O-acyltransferase PlsY [Cyanobacteria bacterium SBLK]